MDRKKKDKATADRKTVALAGNPNVGKSTVFNRLTGMHQHTGNWAGKTVVNAQGVCNCGGHSFLITDLPGCYSLYPQSAEEEVARDYICSNKADVTVVVCSASCLERSLNLALQIMETTDRVVVCVNLMDEAESKGVSLNLDLLQERLRVPVIGISARSGDGVERLMGTVWHTAQWQSEQSPYAVTYPAHIESAVRWIIPELGLHPAKEKRSMALSLLYAGDGAADVIQNLSAVDRKALSRRLNEARNRIAAQGISDEQLMDDISSASVRAAAAVCDGVVSGQTSGYGKRDMMIDRLLTGRWTSGIFMLLLLLVVFWITLSGANYISDALRWLFDRAEGALYTFLSEISCPVWLRDLMVRGVFRILGWIISVMLPPMAIFFPMFTLLEDIGFLPRLAFNMDHAFKRCGACGKQALTMCMGFGCNAAGVTGCRIIESPRERLIAILTNSLVPCNGRFPLLAAIITMFLTGALTGAAASIASALLMVSAVMLGVAVTFGVSKLLSCTLLKGMPSSLVLELPPYRRPQWGRVIVRSIFDRTLFVLGRAIVSAAPAGAIIWIMANVQVSGGTLLSVCSDFLEPVGRLLGMDGAILLAFILGFPANEIVIALILMIYSSGAQLTDMGSLTQVSALLTANGWTWVTGVCVMLFSLMHWPCSTTCMTIYKETRSIRWTAAAILLPTLLGAALCMLVNAIAGLFV